MARIGGWLLGMVVLLASPALAAEVVVIDGDTLEIAGTRYRIYGIDAPEAGQRCAAAGGGTWRCGRAAVRAMEGLLLAATTIDCADGPLDDYGRRISVCRADGVDVGRKLVELGLAWAYVRFSADYRSQEMVAKASAVGVWQAATQTPWDYRAERWAISVQTAPEANCPIKGNINFAGERIYHVPWSPDYDRTRIDVSKGERWFCDEAEALRAGWRAPHWGTADGSPGG